MKPKTLYRLVFPDGRTYVGITKLTLAGRMYGHRTDAKTGTSKVYVAWREVGEPRIEALAVVEDHMWRATEHRALEVLKPELNSYPGGNGSGRTTSDETRAKISASSLGRKLPPRSPEHRAKISAAKRARDRHDKQPQTTERIL